jgi:hypothetical protein
MYSTPESRSTIKALKNSLCRIAANLPQLWFQNSPDIPGSFQAVVALHTESTKHHDWKGKYKNVIKIQNVFVKGVRYLPKQTNRNEHII